MAQYHLSTISVPPNTSTFTRAVMGELSKLWLQQVLIWNGRHSKTTLSETYVNQLFPPMLQQVLKGKPCSFGSHCSPKRYKDRYTLFLAPLSDRSHGFDILLTVSCWHFQQRSPWRSKIHSRLVEFPDSAVISVIDTDRHEVSTQARLHKATLLVSPSD